MRRTLTAVLLAAMLAFSLVPAYADPGIGEEQYGGLQEAVDAAKDGEIIEVSKEDDAESITVAGKAVIICVVDGEWSERTTDTECIARLSGNDGNGAYYVVGDLDRCVACDTKAICGAEAAIYELKKSIKLKSDVTFANCGADTSGITVKRELCIDLNGRTIAQERGENAYNVHAAVNVLPIQQHFPRNAASFHQVIHTVEGFKKGGLAAARRANEGGDFICAEV